MIHLSGVSKWYQGQNRILNHVQLDLKQGEFLYVVGGSGAGKSSLLRLLATQEFASQGSVNLFGYNVASSSPSTLRAIRQSLGYVPQDIQLIPDLSVFDNLAFSLALAGKRVLSAESRLRIHDLLQRLGLESKKNEMAARLSGGEAQRVAVARALVRSPELIIADEPTGSQDRDYTWSMVDLLMKANQAGATVILATHDREIVRRVRKRAAVLKNGNIQFEEGLCIY